MAVVYQLSVRTWFFTEAYASSANRPARLAQSLAIGLGGVLVALRGPTGGWAPLNAVFVRFTLIGALMVSRRAALPAGADVG